MTPHEAPVTVSATYSCGCIQRPGEPLPASEANWLPGRAIICERHEEFAVVTRVTLRLVPTPAVLKALLVDGGVEPGTAEYVAEMHGRV